MELPRGLGKDNLFMPMMVCVGRFLLIIRVVGGILGDRELGDPRTSALKNIGIGTLCSTWVHTPSIRYTPN